jgi:hypothetical protein
MVSQSLLMSMRFPRGNGKQELEDSIFLKLWSNATIIC